MAWYKDGKIHRSGSTPAVVSYFENGIIEHEMWYTHNKLNRPGGAPAIIYYCENGQIRNELWYKNGEKQFFCKSLCRCV